MNGILEDGSIPAFPGTHEVPAQPGCERSIRVNDGMSLRDYFAGQAITGCLPGDKTDIADERAMWAYRMADAMLAARGKS